MKPFLLITSLLILQFTCFISTIYLKPTDWFGVFYFVWVLVPATIAAIGFAPRWHFLASVLNAIVSTALFDYLFLQHGYFWPNRPAESPGLAIGYILIGVVLAAIVAGFVHSIIVRIDHATQDKMVNPIGAAARNGLVLSTIFGVLSSPILYLLLPAQSSHELRLTTSGIFAIGLITIGTIISILVGATYRPDRPMESPNGSNGQLPSRDCDG